MTKTRKETRKILVLIFLAACLTASVLPVPDALAAEVFTKNQDLEGSVEGGTAEGVEFENICGSRYKDV